jgi:hypothetical protein
MSLPTLSHGDRSNFKKCVNYAGILLKTKDRCGKPGAKAGMSMKTKEMSVKSGNVIENE